MTTAQVLQCLELLLFIVIGVPAMTFYIGLVLDIEK